MISRQYLARPPADWMPIEFEASRDVHPAHLRRLAEQITVVGSEASGR